MRQVYRQGEKIKNSEKKYNDITDELSLAIKLQRADPDFIRTVSCIRDSYYIFLATDVQLSDVAKFSCEENNVFCVDTTFNLCKNWVTDSCFNNA